MGYSFVDKEVCRLLSEQGASSVVLFFVFVLLPGFSLLGAVLMFPQLNVHIIFVDSVFVEEV